MTLLQIDRKAVTQTDAAELLEASVALSDPFGVPTVVFRSEEYSASVIDRYKTAKRVDRRFEEASAGNPSLHIYGAFMGERVFGYLGEFGRGQTIFNAVSIPCKTMNSNERDAHHYEPEKFMPPEMNVVVLPSIKVTMSQLRTEFDYRVDHHNLPGSPEQWQFRTIWHEFAHGAGAGEPQADAMAAAVMRKAFKGRDVLMAQADHRAFRSLFHYSNVEVRQEYGWGVVEAVDYVAALPNSVIDNLSENEIRDMRFQKFETMEERIERLGRILQEVDGYRFRIEDPAFFVNVVDNLYGSADFDDIDRRILQRFQLACARIPRGKDAYAEGLNTELLAVTKQKPLTFTPEYMPEG